MNMFRKLFGRKKSKSNLAVPDADLALDENEARSLVANGGPNASVVFISDDHRRVIFVNKQSFSPDEIDGLRDAIESSMVYLNAKVVKTPTFPVFILKPTIYDHPDPLQAYWIETFPNISGKDRLIIELLSNLHHFGQGPMGICFHFYTPRTELLFRAGYWMLSPEYNLGQLLVQADEYLATLPENLRSYSNAVNHYLRKASWTA